MDKLKKFDRSSLNDKIISKKIPYVQMPNFHPEIFKYALSAAEGICKWAKPKQDAFAIAQGNVQEKMELAKSRLTLKF